MKFGINLRGDLAKLTDAELANRLEEQWRSYESTNARGRWGGWLIHTARGPIRHPRMYRFLAAFSMTGNGGLLDVLLALAFSGKTTEKFLHGADPVTGSHLALCEIRDIVDEIERRVKQKQRQKP